MTERVLKETSEPSRDKRRDFRKVKKYGLIHDNNANPGLDYYIGPWDEGDYVRKEDYDALLEAYEKLKQENEERKTYNGSSKAEYEYESNLP